jgi:hypothetical protein
VILCGVEDEVALLAEVNRAEAAGISMSLFYEPDSGFHEVSGPPLGFTAACSRPVKGEQRAIFRDCKLLK